MGMRKLFVSLGVNAVVLLSVSSGANADFKWTPYGF